MEPSPRKPGGKSLFVMVGDVSADRHTSRVIDELKKSAPDLHVWGGGGNAMRDAGVELLRNCEDVTVIGIVELVGRAAFFYKLRQQLLSEVEKRRPDAVLLVDMGTFNLQLSKDIKSRYPDVPILYFISPQIWGSRPWRVNTMAKTIAKVLVIFKFEEKIYQDKGVAARFVGHPLLSNIPTEILTREEFCQQNKLNPEQPIISIFAGSRRKEVTDFSPVVLQAVKELLDERPDLQFLISASDVKLRVIFEAAIKKAKLDHLLGDRMHLFAAQHNYEMMKAADLVWTKNGTTALEVTIIGAPMLVFYRAMWLSYILFCIFKLVKTATWANMMHGSSLVPELYQLDCRAQQLVKYTRDWLAVPQLRAEVRQELLTLRAQLGQGEYAKNVADEIVSLVNATGEKPREATG